MTLRVRSGGGRDRLLARLEPPPNVGPETGELEQFLTSDGEAEWPMLDDAARHS